MNLLNRERAKHLIALDCVILRLGRVLERTFKSGDTLPAADVMDMEMQYLYNDGELWYFMSPETFEQHTANAAAMEDAKQWLKGQETCIITMYNGQPLSVAAPNFVILKITQSDPGVKGDTARGGTKPATLETGVIIQVPLFVEEGELIKVDTRNSEYSSRIKE